MYFFPLLFLILQFPPQSAEFLVFYTQTTPQKQWNRTNPEKKNSKPKQVFLRLQNFRLNISEKQIRKDWQA